MWHPNWVRLAPTEWEKSWDFLRSISVHFGSPKLILKSHRLTTFYDNLTLIEPNLTPGYLSEIPECFLKRLKSDKSLFYLNVSPKQMRNEMNDVKFSLKLGPILTKWDNKLT